MTLPFDVILGIGVSLLGIISAIAHRKRCSLRHDGVRYDWGVGYGETDSPVEPSNVVILRKSTTRCVQIPEMLAVIRCAIRRVRG